MAIDRYSDEQGGDWYAELLADQNKRAREKMAKSTDAKAGAMNQLMSTASSMGGGMGGGGSGGGMDLSSLLGTGSKSASPSTDGGVGSTLSTSGLASGGATAAPSSGGGLSSAFNTGGLASGGGAGGSAGSMAGGMGGSVGGAGGAGSYGMMMQETSRLAPKMTQAMFGDSNEYNLYDVANEEGWGYGGGTLSGIKMGSAGGPWGMLAGAVVGGAVDGTTHIWKPKADREAAQRKYNQQMSVLLADKTQALGGGKTDFGEQDALASIFNAGRKR